MASGERPGIALLIARKVAKAQPWSKGKGKDMGDGDEEGSDAEEEAESPGEEKREDSEDSSLGDDLSRALASKDGAAIAEAVRAICR